MSRERIRVGTRGSALALAQARQVAASFVAASFESQGRPTRLVVVETEGDRREANTAWGEGAFVAAIERALLDDRVDVAVHSAKDIPTDEDDRLCIAAYLPRDDAADVLVVRESEPVGSLEELPSGSRVGTDSPRRQGFLLAARPDLHVHPLHGNVDTRLRRLDDGETDALVLAAAGLRRLGRDGRINVRFDASVIPPAAGQGAIAVQVRSSDARMMALAAALDDPATRLAVEAERRFLAGCGGGCRAPIGALASVVAGSLELIAGRVDPDGRGAHFETVVGAAGDSDALVDELLRRFSVARPAATSEERRPLVLVTRPKAQAETLVAALAERGSEAFVAPTIAIDAASDSAQVESAVARLGDFRWAIVTSASGANAVATALRTRGADPHGTSWAALGAGSATALTSLGIEPWLPSRATSAALGEELPLEPGDRVVLFRGDLADASLPAKLAARGARVEDVKVYRTIEAPAGSAPLVAAALNGRPLSAVVFASPSAIRGLLALAGERQDAVRGVPAVCIGETTAAAAKALGFARVIAAPRPHAAAVADCIADLAGQATEARR